MIVLRPIPVHLGVGVGVGTRFLVGGIAEVTELLLATCLDLVVVTRHFPHCSSAPPLVNAMAIMVVTVAILKMLGEVGLDEKMTYR